MDLGLEGGFLAPKCSINPDIHSSYIEQYDENYVFLKKTGFNTVFANDILPYAKIAWDNFFKQKNNLQDSPYHLESIVDLVKQHESGEFQFPQNIDIVTGGFPCQDFSVAGNRQGFDSTKSHDGNLTDEPNEENRGQLYLWMKEVIQITKPKLFIAENVKGLISLGDVKEIIQKDFRSIDEGYTLLDAQILNAKDYGVAQNRERIIFIGISNRYLKKDVLQNLLDKEKNSPFYPYPPKTHGNDGSLMPYATLQKVIGFLPEPTECLEDISQKSLSKAKLFKNRQGNIEINMQGQSPTIRAEHHGNIEFRRLAEENGGKNHKEYHLPQRRLTVRECALIQSFPPNYEFVFNKGKNNSISASSAYRVIGNAVPPLLGFALGTHIKSIWDQIFDEDSSTTEMEQKDLFID